MSKKQTYNNLLATIKELNAEFSQIHFYFNIDEDNEKKVWITDGNQAFDSEYYDESSNTSANDILKELAVAYNKDREKKLWKFKAKIKDKDDEKAIVFKRNPIFIILFLFLFIGLVGFGIYSYLQSDGTILNRNPKTTADVADGTDIETPEETFDPTASVAYFGLGNITVTADQPNVPLINVEENDVYMQYTVTLDGQVLYTSDLIEPGKMVEYDVYDALDAGDYTLIYRVASYDLETREQTEMSPEIKQDITVEK